jgi:DNA replication protein DnaC
MQHETIESHLIQLKLQGMLSAFRDGPKEHAMSDEQWAQFLSELLDAEIAHRQARSYAYRLKLAKLGQVKTFDNFDASDLPIKPEKLEQIKTCEFIESCENVLLIGGSGTGKTHLALALAHKALQKNYRVKFYKFSHLARSLLTAQEHRHESNFIEKLMRFDMLIVDELGYLPIDQKAGPLLFELLSGFYELGSIIIGTHLTFDEWGDVFGGNKITKTLIDRMTHHSHILETGDKSWRLKEVNERKN